MAARRRRWRRSDEPEQTPSQTVGPFFAFGLTPELYRYAYRSAVGDRLVQSGTEGQRIRIEGRVLDGNGEPIPDAMIELWQANAHGRYNHPADDAPTTSSTRTFAASGAPARAPSPTASSFRHG